LIECQLGGNTGIGAAENDGKWILAESKLRSLWTIVVILVILWLLGALGTVSIPVLSGNTVHLLLVIVIIIVVVRLLRGRL